MLSEDDLQELADAAVQLNARTDAMNEPIKALEDRLAKMKIGVNVWLDVVLARQVTSSPINKADKVVGVGVVGEKFRMNGFLLGYGKCDSGWRIVVKKIVRTWQENQGEVFNEVQRSDEDHLPLLEAGRNLRIEAVPHFNELVELLCNKVWEVVVKIEELQGEDEPKEEKKGKKH